MTPMSRSAASLPSVSVPGSHSNVISSARLQALIAFRLFTRAWSWRTERNDGVPPPKYTKSSARTCNGRLLVVQLPFTRQHVQIHLDLAGVLVGVDAEVTEVAVLSAEWDVKVQS